MPWYNKDAYASDYENATANEEDQFSIGLEYFFFFFLIFTLNTAHQVTSAHIMQHIGGYACLKTERLLFKSFV